ncbi:ABC-three component system middle component 4 [Paenibacillus sp. FSL R10-2734]|uniref:ABC-three component system middle component 4 n=1 Tax=Paenibacillus sp. FSL R10-2734 TaxID=2954691 RepID=UPI0030D982FC
MQNNNLPASLRLLFNNPFLEMMNVLFIINAFSNKSGLNIRHILFYYSLALSDNEVTIFNIDTKPNDLQDSENVYFDIQRQIKVIILNLYSQNYISISNDKTENYSCSMTTEGLQMISQLESPYYKKLQERIEGIKKQTKYSVESEKIIMGVKK